MGLRQFAPARGTVTIALAETLAGAGNRFGDFCIQTSAGSALPPTAESSHAVSGDSLAEVVRYRSCPERDQWRRDGCFPRRSVAQLAAGLWPACMRNSRLPPSRHRTRCTGGAQAFATALAMRVLPGRGRRGRAPCCLTPLQRRARAGPRYGSPDGLASTRTRAASSGRR